jgi:hypothetical protein
MATTNISANKSSEIVKKAIECASELYDELEKKGHIYTGERKKERWPGTINVKRLGSN